jgi:hypothetical protein
MGAENVLLAVAVDTERTAAFYLPANCLGFMVKIPALVGPGSVRAEVYAGVDPSPFDKSNAVLAASSNTDWWSVDVVLDTTLSGTVSSVAQNWKLGGRWVRFYVPVQLADQTFKVFWSN